LEIGHREKKRKDEFGEEMMLNWVKLKGEITIAKNMRKKNESMNWEESTNSRTYIKLNIGVVNFYSVNVNCESQGIKVSLKTV
jgi:hypothetical protein